MDKHITDPTSTSDEYIGLPSGFLIAGSLDDAEGELLYRRGEIYWVAMDPTVGGEVKRS